MRIALFSDIHANLEALDAVLADAAAQGCDSHICLGDIVGYNAVFRLPVLSAFKPSDAPSSKAIMTKTALVTAHWR